MIRSFILYGHPKNPDAFARHYRETHIPLVWKMPKLRDFLVSSGPVTSAGEPSEYHLIAELVYDSEEDAAEALGSPEGEAAVADLAKFADGGVTVLSAEMESAPR